MTTKKTPVIKVCMCGEQFTGRAARCTNCKVIENWPHSQTFSRKIADRVYGSIQCAFNDQKLARDGGFHTCNMDDVASGAVITPEQFRKNVIAKVEQDTGYTIEV